MDNNTFYFNRFITQKTGKILRPTELVCCIVCLALAVTIFFIRLHFVTKVILMVVSTTFLLVTLVDTIGWIQSRPMGHRTWIVFSVTAFHMFCLCGGFLLFLTRVTNQGLLLVTCVMNFLTGYVYILDCLLIVLQYLKWIHRNNTRVVPTNLQVDKAVSACLIHQEWEYVSRNALRMRSTLRPRPQVVPTYSYGGTFAVSKDFPPLPTPDPLREFSPRKRMYSTLVNPYPILEGSGDFNRRYQKTPPKENETNPFLVAKDQSSSSALLGKFRYSRMRSQSCGEGSASTQVTELNKIREEDTDVDEENDTFDQNQVSKEMIVAYCKPESGNPAISMQDSVFHQYYQQPCLKCGRTHYQQQTTINGTLCCPPVVCNTTKSGNMPPMQIIQIPCSGIQNCPGVQGRTQQMMRPCGNINCPNAQASDKGTYVGNSTSSIKRNGLQPEYSPTRRFGLEPQDCPPCGRLYKPQTYAEESGITYCEKDCPRPSKFAEPQQFVAPYNCCCSPPPPTAAAETSTEQEERKNSEVMAVQEMTDKNVQIIRSTGEYNPQTSETRIVTASYMKKLLEGNCDAQCTGKKSSQESSSISEESSERDTTESEEPDPPLNVTQPQRESKGSKASKVSKISKASAKSKETRLTAGGTLQESERDQFSKISAQEQVSTTNTAESARVPSAGRMHTQQIPSKTSNRDMRRRGDFEESQIQKSRINANLESVPKEMSVCECIALGKPSKDCKRTRSRRTYEYDKGKISYRDLPQDSSSDEPIQETVYDDVEIEPQQEPTSPQESPLEQPVDEPHFQKTRAPKRLATEQPTRPNPEVVSQSSKGLPQEPYYETEQGHEPTIKSRTSNGEIAEQRSVHEPSITETEPERSTHLPSFKSKLLNSEIAEQRSVHEPSNTSKQTSIGETAPQTSTYQPLNIPKMSNREMAEQRSVLDPAITSKQTSIGETAPQTSTYQPLNIPKMSNREIAEQRSVLDPSITSKQTSIGETAPQTSTYQPLNIPKMSNREIAEQRSLLDPSITSKHMSIRETEPQRSTYQPTIIPKMSNREMAEQRSVLDPSITSKHKSIREIDPRYEPSIQSRASSDAETQGSIREPLVQSNQTAYLGADGVDIVYGPKIRQYHMEESEPEYSDKGNQEWCEKCCNEEKLKPKKWWNIFKRKKK